jgi:hypothetical protein
MLSSLNMDVRVMLYNDKSSNTQMLDSSLVRGIARKKWP